MSAARARWWFDVDAEMVDELEQLEPAPAGERGPGHLQSIEGFGAYQSGDLPLEQVHVAGDAVAYDYLAVER